MKRYVIKSTGESAEHRSGTLITWHDHVTAITAVEDERDRLREALESNVRGFDAIRTIICEQRENGSKIHDIRAAAIQQRYKTVAALQEDTDE